jgi:hypothetical protein
MKAAKIGAYQRYCSKVSLLITSKSVENKPKLLRPEKATSVLQAVINPS